MALQRINPDSLERSPYYAQAMLVPAGASMVLVGGQNAVNAAGEMVGGDDVAAQSEQVMRNVLACLEAAGARASDLVSLEIKAVDGVDLGVARRAAAAMLDENALPVVSGSFVSRLARPGALIEVSALAAVFDPGDATWLGRGETHDPAWF